MKKKQIHLVGNAHLDPVWLWRFQEGFAEIKATFRSALDRIKENDAFIFTSACASYYKWVEENCPSMFEEIKAAVKAGKWQIVGGMWIQPDCNIPSSESFARHFLYSQKYFEEKFGITVKTGYNVDTFGHSAGLPRLFSEGGIDNYVFMRPSAGNEKEYPFPNYTFRWKAGECEVVTSRLRAYGGTHAGKVFEEKLVEYDNCASENDEDIMMFYGVGNHGGGPTVRSLKTIDGYLPKANNDMFYSHPDAYFDYMRQTAYEQMPVYEGELQNHASGCYSANSKMKALNRAGENRLNTAERMEVLANAITGAPMNPERNAEAWQCILFNQFHDIICGCSIKAAYDDAYAFGGAAVAHGLKLTNEAAQRISWAIDTSKDQDLTGLCKESDWCVWDHNEVGAPLVVFNPLSHPVQIPVHYHRRQCTAICDENGTPVPYQMVRCDYIDGRDNKYYVRFLAEVPAYGWKTFWSYNTENVSHKHEAPYMQVTETSLSNDRISVHFDEATGCISSITDTDGKALIGSYAAKAVVIDDTENDTWAHGKFVFDQKIGEFSNPTFEIAENGVCEVSLRVKQTYKNSTLIQTYTLFAHDARVHVSAKLILNEYPVQVKLAFDSGISDADFIREVPGGVISCQTDGREEPMLRWMAAVKGNSGIAVINDSKYSASEAKGVISFIAARSCYYADHYGDRDNTLQPQDIGEQTFSYDIMPYHGDLAAVVRAAEELNTEFPVIPETYHRGPLAQETSNCKVHNDNVTVSAIKPAEDGKGVIVRLNEIGGKACDAVVDILGARICTAMRPHDICSFYVANGDATRCDFTEKAK